MSPDKINLDKTARNKTARNKTAKDKTVNSGMTKSNRLQNFFQTLWRPILAGTLKLTSKLTGGVPKILLFINLPQDLDILLPLAVRLQKMSDYQVEVAVSDKAWNQSPRIGDLLSAAGIQVSILKHKAVVAGLQPQLAGVQAVITASESTANPHKGPYTLTQRANQRGILTYTMQHGFENVGLTYFDAEYPVGAVLFASQTFFTWVAIDQLPAETPAETRQKCVAVGCPKFIDAPYVYGRGREKSNGETDKANDRRSILKQIPGHSSENQLIVIFENLHWSRYSDDYRQRFLQDLEQTALACPNVTFLVKPHHAGLWLTQRYQGEVPITPNLAIADPKAPEWEAFTAPALIEIADAVITTPSTVAIDAVRANCPVAVVAYDLSLPNFEPLPLLRSQADWKQFCAQAHRHRDSLLKALEVFAQNRLVPGDAVQKIIDRLTLDLS